MWYIRVHCELTLQKLAGAIEWTRFTQNVWTPQHLEYATQLYVSDTSPQRKCFEGWLVLESPQFESSPRLDRTRTEYCFGWLISHYDARSPQRSRHRRAVFLYLVRSLVCVPHIGPTRSPRALRKRIYWHRSCSEALGAHQSLCRVSCRRARPYHPHRAH